MRWPRLSRLAALSVIVASILTLLLVGLAGGPSLQAQTVTTTIPVGVALEGLAVNPTTNTIYVSSDAGAVSVIDGATNSVTAAITVGATPVAMAVNATTNTIYVANMFSRSVSVIDGATNKVTATIPVGGGPVGVGINPSTNTIYVANMFSRSVSVIDGATSVTGVTVSLAPTTTGVSATYTIGFSTSATGAISGAGTITLTAAAGTVFPSFSSSPSPNYTVSNATVSGVTRNSVNTGTNNQAVLTLSGAAIANSSGETVSVTGVTNPAAGSYGTGSANPLTVATSADATAAGNATAYVITASSAPAITSTASATFTVGAAGSFTVTTSGSPTPSLSDGGATLPSGVTFTDNGNGTATLAGTPAGGTGGSYPFTITAQNGVSPNATQSFTLTVDQPPAITSAASTTFTAGTAGSFTVTTSGFPAPSLSDGGGTLPSGVTFTDKGNGTATLAGTPAGGSAGSYPFTITAQNGVSPNATQSFTLTVLQPAGGGGGGGVILQPTPIATATPAVTPTRTPTAAPGATTTPTPTPTPGCATVTYAFGWNLAGGPSSTVLTGAAGSLFTFQASDSSYESFPVTTALSGGLGVWAFFFSPTTVTLPCVSKQTQLILLPVSHFIMVGNPGITPATVSGADVVDTFNPATNSYTTVTGTATLAPGQGAWVYSHSGGTLTIANQ